MPQPHLTHTYTGQSGTVYRFEYFECDSFEHLPQDEITQCYAAAFHGDKIVIVHNSKKDTWGLVGGSVEQGETIEETLVREIQEESNMRVVSHKPIGYQRVTDMSSVEKPFYQLRFFAIVEPCGPFESDPADSIDRMLEIDPRDHKQYFDWFEIGDAIIAKAMRLKGVEG